MGYTMKHTDGKKSDTSSFPFKIDAPSATSDSPAKVLGMSDETGGKLGNLAMAYGGYALGPAGVMGGSMIKRQLDGTARDEKKYEDVLASEGLKRNIFGKLGFGGGNSQAREARINELQEQDQMGIDRERIESRGGVTAGPA